jgi:hypothetical protein
VPYRVVPLAILLAVLSSSAPVGAQQSTILEVDPETQEAGQSQEGNTPPVSLERIKKALATPGPKLAQPPYQGDLPTFRATIVGHRLLLPDFQESLKPGWQPVAPGMLYHAEFMSMVTPAQARPYGAFTGTELLQVAFTTLVNHYAQAGVKKGVSAARRLVRSEQQRRIRKQIEAELAAIEEANRKKEETSVK